MSGSNLDKKTKRKTDCVYVSIDEYDKIMESVREKFPLDRDEKIAKNVLKKSNKRSVK